MSYAHFWPEKSPKSAFDPKSGTIGPSFLRFDLGWQPWSRRTQIRGQDLIFPGIRQARPIFICPGNSARNSSRSGACPRISPWKNSHFPASQPWPPRHEKKDINPGPIETNSSRGAHRLGRKSPLFPRPS